MWVSHEMKPLWYECFIMYRVPGCYFLLSQWSCFWLQGTEDPLVLYCWKPVNALPHWIHIESKWKVWLCGGKCRSASVFNVALRRFTSIWAGVLGLVIAHLNMIYIKSKQTKLPFAKLTKSFELPSTDFPFSDYSTIKIVSNGTVTCEELIPKPVPQNKPRLGMSIFSY